VKVGKEKDRSPVARKDIEMILGSLFSMNRFSVSITREEKRRELSQDETNLERKARRVRVSSFKRKFIQEPQHNLTRFIA
jgi:hypothetical protein